MSQEQMFFGWEESDPESRPSGPAPAVIDLSSRLQALAAQRIYLGTSSWKYPGWLGQVYQPGNYQVRGKFSQRKFDQTCLTEYARLFPTVCGDFSFYQFPTDETWREIFEQVAPDFRICLKVPEEVTVERFPDLPRYGKRAGRSNPHFMDAALMKEKLLAPLAPYRDRLGSVILEFGTIHEGPYSDGRNFSQALGQMFGELPVDQYLFAVEVRNPEFLQEASGYLDCIREFGVAHCLNSWTRMPPLEEQLQIPGIFTAPHVAARLLLRPGRSYEQAVKKFAPYNRASEPDEVLRTALRRLIELCKSSGKSLFVLVNNRLEGNAIETIDAATRMVEG